MMHVFRYCCSGDIASWQLRLDCAVAAITIFAYNRTILLEYN